MSAKRLGILLIFVKLRSSSLGRHVTQGDSGGNAHQFQDLASLVDEIEVSKADIPFHMYGVHASKADVSFHIRLRRTTHAHLVSCETKAMVHISPPEIFRVRTRL